MRVSEAFPSKYLKAEVDIFEGEPVNATISAVEVEEFTDNGVKQRKFVLTFEEFDKALVCNKTNSLTLAKLLGEESDDWPGRKITLYSTEVQFKDEMVASIRIKSKLPVERPARGPATTRTKPVPQPAAAPQTAGDIDPDDPNAPPF